MIVLKPATTGQNHMQRARAAFRTAFNYLDSHKNPQMTEEYWRQAADDMMRTYQHSGEDPFLADLLSAVYTELTRRAQEEQNTAAAAI